MTDPLIAARDVTVAYDGDPVVKGLSLELFAGSLTAIVGPNGCGKSTLLRALARVLRPRQGTVLLAGEDLHRLPTRTVAKKMSYLPQAPMAQPGLTVAELVSHGRFPHRRAFVGLGREDRAAIDAAIEVTGLTALRDRPLEQVSGGQRQRAWIAMALCQGATVLLLDEPTNHLDLAHQIEVLDALRWIVTDCGHTVVVVLHDLNLAARCADHLVAMADGRIAARGAPAEVLTPATIRSVFGVEAEVISDPTSGAPVCIPRRVAR